MIPKYIQNCLSIVKASKDPRDEMILCLEGFDKVGGFGFTVGARSITTPVYHLKTIPWPIFVNYCFHATKSDISQMIKYLKK